MIDLAAEPPILRLVAGTGKRGSGSEGNPLDCTMARLHGIFVDEDGAIYIGDSENHRIWVIRTLKTAQVEKPEYQIHIVHRTEAF